MIEFIHAQAHVLRLGGRKKDLRFSSSSTAFCISYERIGSDTTDGGNGLDHIDIPHLCSFIFGGETRRG